MKKLVLFILILFLLTTNVYAFSFSDKISSFSIKDTLSSFSIIDFFNRLFGIEEEVVGINIRSDTKVKPTETPIVNQPIQDTSDIEQPITSPQGIEEPVEDSSGVVNIITQEPIVITQNVPVLTYTLTVVKSGTGSGTVTSSPVGINCGSSCSALYSQNTNVILTATPNATSTFSHWEGACSGTGTCTVSMSFNRLVTAVFNQQSILNGYLSVATLKQSYSINEVIELTDPPNEEGFFSKLIEGIKNIFRKEVKGGEINLDKSIPKKLSLKNMYLIKLKDPPLLKKYLELGINLKEVKSINLIESQQVNNYNKFLNKRQDEFNKQISNLEDVKIIRAYKNVFNGFVVSASSKEIIKLKSLSNVEKIYPLEFSYIFKPALNESVYLINAPLVWNLSSNLSSGINGTGIIISIIDQCINYTLPDFGGCNRTENINDGSCWKVIAGYDFLEYDNDPYCQTLHGTWVAGIVSGLGVSSDGLFKGVAYGSQLYFFSKAPPEVNTPEFLEALERSIDPNLDGIFNDSADIISLSGGTPSQFFNDIDTVYEIINNLKNFGIIFVAAAGNIVNNYGFSEILCPSCVSSAVSVGGVDKFDNIIEEFAVGPGPLLELKPDIVGPASNICAPGSYEELECYNQFYSNSGLGTSFSTPHVSGSLALLKQLYPDLEPEKLKALLIETSVDLGYDILRQGAGRLDVFKAATTPVVAIPYNFRFFISNQTGNQGLNFSINLENITNTIMPNEIFTINISLDPQNEDLTCLLNRNSLDIGNNLINLVCQPINTNDAYAYRTGIFRIENYNLNVSLRIPFMVYFDYSNPFIYDVNIEWGDGEFVVLKWETDDVSTSSLFYREINQGNFYEMQALRSDGFHHFVFLNNLEAGDYLLYISATNLVNLSSINDNGGQYYFFGNLSSYFLTASPLQGVAPLTVLFNLNGDFPINSQFRWFFGDEIVTNSLTSMQHTYNYYGVYNVFVQILQNNQVIDVSNNLTIIVNSPPTFLLTANQTSGVAPLSILFSVDGDFLIGTQFIWYFGDSTQTTTTNTIQHTYQNEGNYNAFVKIIEPGNEPIFSNTVNINVLPKSKIQNTGNNIIQGYLLMKIQKNVNGVWQDYNIIVNDLQTSTLRTIQGNSYLALDEIWNVNNVVINLVGNYRVYAALLNSNGNVIQTQQGSLEDTYEFIVNPTVTIIEEMME